MSFAVLCPGQGAQHPGMLDLALQEPASTQVLDAAAAALGEDPRQWAARPQALFDNATAQPLICIAQLATWAALRERLPRPALLAGYSVGELACYGLAGSLGAASLARLARRRAELMDEAAASSPGGLIAARGLSRRRVAALCAATGASIAIAVDDDAFVVGGTLDALARMQARIEAVGAQLTCLRVGVPSHTRLLAAATAPFRAELQRSLVRAPDVPVVAGIDASVVTSETRAVEVLAAQIGCTVEWSQCIDSLYERGCRVFLELGPGRALSKTVRDRHADVQARSTEEFGSLDAAAAWVRRGVDIR